jgi:hypothetical protein
MFVVASASSPAVLFVTNRGISYFCRLIFEDIVFKEVCLGVRVLYSIVNRRDQVMCWILV